nr:hypothetical protein [Tanacetum cinerariifolium]
QSSWYWLHFSSGSGIFLHWQWKVVLQVGTLITGSEEVFVQEDVVDKEVNAAGEVNAASIVTTDSVAATMTVDEVTLAQALMEIKNTKPKAKRIVQSSWYWLHFSSGSGIFLHWQWKVVLQVGTLITGSEEMFVQEDVVDKEVNAAGEVNAASIVTTDSVATTMTVDEVTLAQALMEIKSTKPKAKRIGL